jgi:hypothetical protein
MSSIFWRRTIAFELGIFKFKGRSPHQSANRRCRLSIEKLRTDDLIRREASFAPPYLSDTVVPAYPRIGIRR